MEEIDLSNFKEAKLHVEKPEVCLIVFETGSDLPMLSDQEHMVAFSMYEKIEEFKGIHSTNSLDVHKYNWHELVEKFGDRFTHIVLDPVMHRISGLIGGIIPLSIE